MGLSEKLEKSAVEQDRRRARERMDKLLAFLESYEAEGLNEILSEIHDLTESGLYGKLIDAFHAEAYAKGKRAFTMEELNRVRVLKLARKNLHLGGFLNSLFTPSFVTAKQILTIHMMINYTYVVFSGRTTKWDDILNIYFSRLDERIIFALDHFDQVKLEELPEPTDEYFQRLKKLKWKDKNTKKFYNKLNDFMMHIKIFVKNYPDLIEQAGWIANYGVTEDLFIQTLAGCGAVNEDRYEVEAEDIITADKTFFKLIKTDVTKYKAIPKLAQGIDGYQMSLETGGYLVCQKCQGHYQLQPGESPEDFSDQCECGGKLEYHKDID